MEYQQLPATMLLQDGTVYRGHAAGKVGTTTGELCFNTGMTGYQEIFTDPSYYRQLMIMTSVHIGNYGVLDEEAQSTGPQISGMICRNFSNKFSRFRSDDGLQEWFMHHNLVGLSGIDTRALVLHIRSKGNMNAIISSETDDIEELTRQLKDTPDMSGLQLSDEVSCKNPYTLEAQDAKYHIACSRLRHQEEHTQ